MYKEYDKFLSISLFDMYNKKCAMYNVQMYQIKMHRYLYITLLEKNCNQ